jgi:hypothetical protein
VNEIVTTVLAVLVSVRCIHLAGFIGLSLTMAELTDFCPMAMLLNKMPRNIRAVDT